MTRYLDALGVAADGTPLAFPIDAITQKFAFMAQSGAGKSYAAMRLAETMLEVGAQVVVLDPVGVWWGLRAAADGVGPGLPIPVLGGDHGDVPLDAHGGAAVADLLVDEGISAVLDLAEFDQAEHKRFVRDFAEQFFQRKKAARSPVHVFFEEAQVIAPLTPERDETVMLNRVERLCRIGRNYGIGWTIISQRPQDVHTKVRNQAGTLVALRTIGTHERRAITDWLNDKARTQGEVHLMDQLPELDTGVALVWSPAWLRLAMTVRITPKHTFDSSATPTVGADLVEARQLAPIDLDRIRSRLAVTAEQPPTDTAADVRRRIATLTRELEVARSQPPRVHRERVVEQITVPTLDAGLVDRLDTTLQQVRTSADSLLALVDQIEAARDRMLDAHAAVTERLGLLERSPIVQNAEAAVPTGHNGEAVAYRTQPQAMGSGQKLARAERKILTVLAQYPDGRSKVQVALLTGYAVKGGGFNNALSALRSRGYLEGSTQLTSTEAGRDALGAWEPLPTGPALVAYWHAQLHKAERTILDVLLAASETTLTKAEVAERAGYEVGGGGFNNALSRLRTLELVHGRRELQASAAFLSVARAHG